MEHSQWTLAIPSSGSDPIAGSFSATESSESASGESYCQVKIVIGVHRRFEFMLWNLLFPAFMLGSSVLTQWGIPMEMADGRLGLCFGLLLALIALKFVIVNLLPAVSYLTFLDEYMLRCGRALEGDSLCGRAHVAT